METQFNKLNPLLNHSEIGHQLVFNCPHCKELVSIYVAVNGSPSENPRVWGLTNFQNGWDNVTITPSIGNHPVGRKTSNCHFSVINGKIIP